MVKEKYRFDFFDTFVEVEELTVEQFIRIHNPEDKKIFFEIFWKKVYEMNERQIKNALEILIIWEQKNIFSEKNKSPWNIITFEDFFILEWRIMHFLHQQRSEIRTWSLRYFYKILENIDVIIWEKSFDDYKNKDKPDKKAIKESLKTEF